MTDQNFDNDLVKNTESRADSTEDNAQSAKVTDEQGDRPLEFDI